MPSLDEKYINAFSEMHEDDFTRKIIKPLFEAMGYSRVEFNGGPLERGRDLIAQMSIPPNIDPLVAYVQSKKIGKIQNTSTAAKFTQLVHQLRQCLSEEITTLEGRSLKANIVYLAAPEAMSTRFIDEVKGQVFGGIGNNCGVRLELIDGPRVIDLAKRFCPEILKAILEKDGEIFVGDNSQLVNLELLSALKSRNQASITDYYTDLNFFVGSVDTNILLHQLPKFESESVEIRLDEWASLKEHVETINNKYGVYLLADQIGEIESTYDECFKKYDSRSNKNKMAEVVNLRAELASCCVEAERDANNLVYLVGSALGSNVNEKLASNKASSFTEGIERSVLLKWQHTLGDVIDQIRTKEINISEFSEIEKDKKFFPKVSKLFEYLINISAINDALLIAEGEVVPEPKYSVDFNDLILENCAKKYSFDYISSVEVINKNNSSAGDLKLFLVDTACALSFFGQFWDRKRALHKYVKFVSVERESDRVSISPHAIFSTGINVAVYGGAGVGKTTTLQAFVAKSDAGDRIVAYLPLNRLVQRYRREMSGPASELVAEKLILSLILMSKDKEISSESLEQVEVLLQRPVSIVFDGIDEIYNVMPGFLPSLNSFSSSFSSVQIIVSSRDCVSYLPEIEFLGITLLPFTPTQLKMFVEGWVVDSEKRKRLIENIDRRALFEHIKTPLLATITCALVEKGIDAPSSEFEIYNQRIRLLSGDYDDHKGISRQSNDSELLRVCARKIAYSMHRQQIRSASRKSVFTFLRESFPGSFSSDLLESCLNDLVDPCNILIEDQIGHDLSFGHFRFQEHLASVELGSNRDIDLADLARRDWWRGALSLYAQNNPFFDLFEEVYDRFGDISPALSCLQSMIASAPAENRNVLVALKNEYVDLSKIDIFADPDIDRDYDIELFLKERF